MNTCENVIPQEKIKVYDFLMKKTPTYSTWIITNCGWREGIFYIDDEDLWVVWYPKQHENAIVKSYSYDFLNNKGIIEYVKGE